MKAAQTIARRNDSALLTVAQEAGHWFAPPLLTQPSLATRSSLAADIALKGFLHEFGLAAVVIFKLHQ